MVLLVLVDKLMTVAALFWGMYSSFKVLKLDHDHDKHVVDAKLGVGARERDGGREARAAAGPRAVQVAAEDYDDDEGQEAMRRGEESLMYWVFLALLSLYNKYFEILFFWLPFYYEAKVLFLCLFMVPYFGMPRYLFTTFLKPFMKKHVSRWIAEASPWVHTRLTRVARKCQEFMLTITSRSVPANELREWEGSLRQQLAATRSERQRRRTGGVASYARGASPGPVRKAPDTDGEHDD